MQSFWKVNTLCAAIIPLSTVRVTSAASDALSASALLLDVSERSTTLDTPIAGHDGHFFVASTDGKFKLQIGGELQFRYYGTFDATSSADNYDGGFQHNRARLEFRGYVIDPRVTYRILANFNRDTGLLELQDAYAEYELKNKVKVRWGQFKLPFDREFFASSPWAVQGIEASLASSVFRLDRSQGIMFSYQAERWQVATAVSDGRRAGNTTYDSTCEADIAMTARVEFRLGAAPWKQFRDQTAFRGDKNGFLIGLGGHWQQEGSTGAQSSTTGTANLYQYTIDVGFEGNGWNALAAYTARLIDADDALHDSGALVQAGVFVTDSAEIFARYARIFPENKRSGGNDDFSAITGGFNWYFMPNSHALKLTGELTWYPDTQADSASIVRAPDTGIGLLGDSDGGQVGIGMQMQLLF